MNTEQDLSLSGVASENQSTSPIVVLMDLITRWRRALLFSVAIGLIVSTAVAFLIPPKFKSSASVFPAEKADLIGAFGSLQGGSSLIKSFSQARGLAALARDPELDKYIAILKSDRVLGGIIRDFDLVKVYDITSYPAENTVKELLSNIDFKIEPEGNLTIGVFDEDPQRAADMANSFVDALNRANIELQAQNARGNRRFIEERYLKNLADLRNAEDSLRAFQKKYGVLAIPEQAEASLKAVAEMAARLAMTEVKLGAQMKVLSADHAHVIESRIEIEELKKKISQFSISSSDIKGGMRVFIPLSDIPDLGAEYLRRYREVEIQYKILQFITPLFEQAKVEEQRQTPTVVVLDSASPAERKAKPKRLFIILGGTFIALFGCLLFAAISDRWEYGRLSNSVRYQSAQRMFTALGDETRWLLGFFRSRK